MRYRGNKNSLEEQTHERNGQKARKHNAINKMIGWQKQEKLSDN